MTAPRPTGEPVSRINIVQGEEHVSGDAAVMLTTLLGSCVAACLHDPVAKVGGMNHFLLPGEAQSVRHGVHAMELLVNALFRAGARRERLEAKLFGGAQMLRGLTDVGESNAAFAQTFLQREGITCAGGSLRGKQGRRLQFWPYSGRARQSLMPPADLTAFDVEAYGSRRQPVDAGALELF